MNDDIWSRQFYKALEAVGKLTEVEKIRLANILIAVNDIEENATLIVDSVSKGVAISSPPLPPPNRKAGMF